VVVSQRLAKANWPGKDPVGQQISLDNGVHWMTIVGVAGDVHQNSLSQDVTDEIYLPLFNPQNVGTDTRVLVRTTSDPTPMGNAIRAAVREIDPRQPVVSIQTLAELRGAKLTEPRVTTALLVSYAARSDPFNPLKSASSAQIFCLGGQKSGVRRDRPRRQESGARESKIHEPGARARTAVPSQQCSSISTISDIVVMPRSRA
jgi:hypothetical protein